MKKTGMIWLFSALLLAGPLATPGHSAPWSGVDEAVIEKIAEKAGRPAQAPLIDTDQGDLLLFVFLLAGAAGGFAAGYWFRILFPPGRKKVHAGPAEAPQGGGPEGKDGARSSNHDV
ncbi:MAG: hypothetical protein LLG97_08755 [Deltaproteobacteria bacterium]|nr:hypothetical protein [Deltaproteobacteria bacterium]